MVYSCLKRRCAAVKMVYLDEYIERLVVAWLRQGDVHEGLHQAFDDREAVQARADAERLRATLDGYRKAAASGEWEAEDLHPIMAGLKTQIGQAEARAQASSLPAVLRGRTGEHAAMEWAALDLSVKREIIKTLVKIELVPAGKGVRGFGPHRVKLEWTYGAATAA